jgi:predicted DNA-binding protein
MNRNGRSGAATWSDGLDIYKNYGNICNTRSKGMTTTLLTFRPDTQLALRLEALAKQTGRSKSHFLKEALTMYLDALEPDYRKAQQVITQARAREEKAMKNVIGALNLDECSDYSLFEQATDDLHTMMNIRGIWISDEKGKPNPSKTLIAQWKAEQEQFNAKDRNLKMDDRAGNIQIIMECSPQIRAWYESANGKVAHVAAA